MLGPGKKCKSLEESEAYIKKIQIPAVAYYFNQQKFNATEFHDNPVSSFREFSYTKIQKNNPGNSFFAIRKNKVTTQDSFLSIGQNTISEEIIEIKKIRTEEATSSGRKTYFQMTLNIDYDILITERSIYSALDWLGDVGGLADALLILLQVILALFYSEQFRFHLLQSLFEKQVSGQVTSKPSSKHETVKEVLQGREKIEGTAC